MGLICESTQRVPAKSFLVRVWRRDPLKGATCRDPLRQKERKRTPLLLPPRMTRFQKSRPARLYG